MIYLAKLFVFVLVWVSVGMAFTHFFYPELWDNPTTRDTIPWLLAIGYFVGSLAEGVSSGVVNILKSKSSKKMS